MKGHAKIELYDAKTGVMTDCVESDNIVTNFFDVLFNKNLQVIAKLSGGVNGNTMLDSLLNMPNSVVKDLFTGVMIFSEAIPEDPDHVYPTVAEAKTMIGNGNMAQSIQGSIFKGAFVEQESEFEDGHATLVWEFGSSVCNGDIACICLTSNRGGHLGCRFNAKDSSNGCVEHIIGLTRVVWGNLTDKPEGFVNRYLLYNIAAPAYNFSIIETDEAFHAANGNLAYESVRDIESETKVGINDGFRPSSIQHTEYAVDSVPDSMAYDLGNGYCHNAVAVFNEGRMTVTKYIGRFDNIVVYDVPVSNINTSATEFLGVTIKNNNLVCRYMFGDKFIYVVGNINNANAEHKNTLRCYLLNLDGTFISHDTTFSDSVVNIAWGTGRVGGYNDSVFPLINICGEIYLVGTNNYNGFCFFHIDTDTGEIDSFPRFSSPLNYLSSYDRLYVRFDANDGITKLPLVTVSATGHGSDNKFGTKGVAFMPDYLATINNIDTVLTKTPDKTMKIRYTLTQTD